MLYLLIIPEGGGHERPSSGVDLEVEFIPHEFSKIGGLNLVAFPLDILLGENAHDLVMQDGKIAEAVERCGPIELIPGDELLQIDCELVPGCVDIGLALRPDMVDTNHPRFPYIRHSLSL